MTDNNSTELVHVVQPEAPMTAAAGIAAQLDATIRARYSLAIARPRDMDTVRTKVLKDCARPRFAESARYKLPRGGKTLEGPSIRFAESAARALGNLSVDSSVIHDDAERRIVRVTVVDVEANLPFSHDVVVEKFVERNQLRQGQQAVSSRMNSAGRVVYKISADEGELLVKQGALISKAMRNLILRILPADILDEAMQACVATIRDGIKKDPDSERKRVLDAFAAIGVQPADLKAYVGQEHFGEDVIVELRDLYQGIRDGETTWAEVTEAKKAEAKKAETVKAETVKAETVKAATDAPKTLDELAARKKAAKTMKITGADGKPIEVATTVTAPGGESCNECGDVDHETKNCPNK
jgi:hypothetical protein